MTPSSLTAQVGLLRATRLAAAQHGVASRRQLYDAGVPRWLITREIKVGRWKRRGRQSITVHNGPVDAHAQRWIAVIEMGPRAALDGVTCLQENGITALTDDLIHVIVPKGTAKRVVNGVVRHESRRFSEDDVVTTGLRRTKLPVAAVHAGLWSISAAQAVFMLVLPVQQQLCRAKDLADELERVRRHRWRIAMLEGVADLADGVRSLGELDVAREMRSRGLPEPTRQSVRKRPSGTTYLDADFPAFNISLEVDGSQHDLPWARLNDLVRDIDQLVDGRCVVRIPLIAWRLDKARVLDALESLFRSRGWRAAA